MLLKLLPYIALAWISAALLELLKFACAERKGQLPAHPFGSYAWSTVKIGLLFTAAILLSESSSQQMLWNTANRVALLLHR